MRADVRIDGKKAFTLERTYTADAQGRDHVTSTFRDTAGAKVLIMDARLQGGFPVQATVQQLQSKESGRIDLSPGKVSFEVTKASGDKERDEDDALGIVFVGPALTDWMATDGPWRRLIRHETVTFKVAAWRRMSVYSFELKRLDHDDEDGTVLLGMEPSNIIYRTFAQTMRYRFDLKTRRLLSYSGLTALKVRQENGDLEDAVAEIVFQP